MKIYTTKKRHLKILNNKSKFNKGKNRNKHIDCQNTVYI
jgi:hypothetical protein